MGSKDRGRRHTEAWKFAESERTQGVGERRNAAPEHSHGPQDRTRPVSQCDGEDKQETTDGRVVFDQVERLGPYHREENIIFLSVNQKLHLQSQSIYVVIFGSNIVKAAIDQK